ncbi:MAG: hypothetical protein ABID09_01485 [Candidatus Omnitrophota bacterium]
METLKITVRAWLRKAGKDTMLNVLRVLVYISYILYAPTLSSAEEMVGNDALLEMIGGSSLRDEENAGERGPGDQDSGIEDEKGTSYSERLGRVESGVNPDQPIRTGKNIYSIHVEKIRRSDTVSSDVKLIFIYKAEYEYKGIGSDGAYNTVNVEYLSRNIVRKGNYEDYYDEVRSREKEMMILPMNEKKQALLKTIPYHDEGIDTIPSKKIVITADDKFEHITAKEQE